MVGNQLSKVAKRCTPEVLKQFPEEGSSYTVTHPQVAQGQPHNSPKVLMLILLSSYGIWVQGQKYWVVVLKSGNAKRR